MNAARKIMVAGGVALVLGAGPAHAQSPTPSPTVTPAPTPSAPIEHGQFAAIEGVLKAAVANERPVKTPGATARLAARCGALGRSDPVLAAFGRICSKQAADLRIVNGANCSSVPDCRRKLRRRAGLRDAIGTAEAAANPVFKRHIADRRCRQALSASAREVRALHDFATGLRRLADAVGGSRQRLRHIARGLAPLSKLIRSPAERLRALRRQCR